MSEFVASNGIPVTLTNDGVLIVENSDHTYPATIAAGRHVEALREFFQHERDEELGRWRWPENPNVVVYLDGHPSRRSVTVFFEKTGGIVIGMREKFLATSPDDGHESRTAARAYFEAHPESKPWHDAKEGEVWVLDLIASGEGSWFVNDGYFQSTKSLVNRPLTDAAFRSGRRIFPEQKS